MSRTWRWISEAVALAVHDEQIAEHGGAPGVRDRGLLQSGLARAQNRAAYQEPDAADLAAAYAFAIVRDHPFIDGNKRTALVLAEIFLADNGYALNADDTDILKAVLGLTDSSMTEKDFAIWMRSRLR